MANVLGAILSGFKKKKEDEEAVAVAPRPPQTVLNPINQAQASWQNFWQPSPNGVRIRDVVREFPGQAGVMLKDIGQGVARNFANAGLTVARQVDKLAGDGTMPDRYPVQDLITKDSNPELARKVYGSLFGENEVIRTLPARSQDVGTDLEDKYGLPKNAAAPLAAGLVAADTALDVGDVVAPGAGTTVKAAGKKLLQKAGKQVAEEAVEAAAKEGAEKVVLQSVDELAPALQKLAPEVRGTIDTALKALEEKGMTIADDVVKALKSGKVLEGDGFVLQTQANKLVANFDKVLPEVARPSKAAAVVPPVVETPQARPTLDTPTSNTLTPGQEDVAKPAFKDLTDGARDKLAAVIDEPEFQQKLSKVKGKTLTRAEVAEKASQIQTYLQRVFTRSDNELLQAELKNTTDRINQITEQMVQGRVSDDVLKELEDLYIKRKSFGTFGGRILESMKMAGDSTAVTGQRILQEIQANSDANFKEVLDAFNNIDKNNPEEVRAFYRQFVKPTFNEILKEYRYINLLSSPRTQIKNLSANLIDSLATEPLTQVARGIVDRGLSTINPKRPRETYAREAVDYYQGMVSAIPDAISQAKAVLQGKRFNGNPDIKSLPVGKYAADAFAESKNPLKRLAGTKVAADFLEKGKYITRAMEAGDIVFKRLVEGGVTAGMQKRGTRGGVSLSADAIAKKAEARANDVLLRSELDPQNATGQGGLFTVIDQITSLLLSIREKDNFLGNVMQYALPFIRHVNNYLKRTISYTPGIGLATIPGQSAAQVQETVARQMVGGVLLMASLWYTMKADQEDRIVAKAPEDPDLRSLFFASNRKEYSIKLGNTWVEFRNLGVLGATLALTARLQEEFRDERVMTDSELQDVADAYVGMIPYYADMSFVKSMGDLFDAMQGDDNAVKDLVITPLRQLVPLVGAQTWLARLIDPVNRKSQDSDNPALSLVAPLAKNVPFLSKQFDPYPDPLGRPSEIQNPLLNAISPANIGTSQPFFEFMLQNKQLNGQINQLQTDFKNGKIDVGSVYRGVDRIMENFVRSLGGDGSQAPNITPPEGVDLNMMVPNRDLLRAEAAANLDPNLVAQLNEQIPVLKEQLLSAITGEQSASSPLLTTSSSGRVKTSAKVSAPPKVGKLKAISLKLPTPKSVGSTPTGVNLVPDITPPPDVRKRLRA